MTFLDHLNWRYATKKFDPTKKLSAEQLHIVTESLRLSASSFGLQPWKFIIVEDAAIREKLKAAAWGQGQITDASQLIVLCALKDMDPTYVGSFVDHVSKETGAPREALQGYHDMMVGAVAAKKTANTLNTWMQKQVYIALGSLLTACAVNEIDACPIEGFSNDEFNKILELDKYGIESAVVCAVGFRSAEDQSAKKKKVRFPENAVIIKL